MSSFLSSLHQKKMAPKNLYYTELPMPACPPRRWHLDPHKTKPPRHPVTPPGVRHLWTPQKTYPKKSPKPQEVYCWWFRNPAKNQLRLVNLTWFTGFLWPSQVGGLGFLNHQQYDWIYRERKIQSPLPTVLFFRGYMDVLVFGVTNNLWFRVTFSPSQKGHWQNCHVLQGLPLANAKTPFWPVFHLRKNQRYMKKLKTTTWYAID